MKLREYVEEFNRKDKEYIETDIANSEAAQWMEEEIPLLECSDKTIEKTYYFRWWTYRKHIKKTPEGYMISEFLPDVPWSGIYNIINAPVGHHLMEGRWLKHTERYLGEYTDIFFAHPESQRYSTWMLWGMARWNDVKNCVDPEAFLKKAIPYYQRWEETHRTDTDLFWSVDDYDAMEYSISGSPNKKPIPGLRPTLNSYMYGDAKAIYDFSKRNGTPLEEYNTKAETIRTAMQKMLWREGFFKALHPADGDYQHAAAMDTKDVPRELIGYIPWYFSIPQSGEEVFDLLGDEKVFLAKQGLATAEQTAKEFLYEVDHECLWNGYVWPFATSQTLTALTNVILQSEANRKRYTELFYRLLHDYAAQHTRTDEDGKEVMWIDEVMSPMEHVWTSRELLKEWGWQTEKGGFERGKDYNHSTFCDLVISALTGFENKDGKVTFNPMIPEDWEYFALDKLYICGDCYRVEYDKTGEHYGAAGLRIYKNGNII